VRDGVDVHQGDYPRIVDLDAGDRVIHHQTRNFLKKWWTLSYPREELINKLSGLTRYIVCGRVTKRPVFEFISSDIRPSDALQVFTLPDEVLVQTLSRADNQ
jgi:hypothetical protein